MIIRNDKRKGCIFAEALLSAFYRFGENVGSWVRAIAFVILAIHGWYAVFRPNKQFNVQIQEKTPLLPVKLTVIATRRVPIFHRTNVPPEGRYLLD